MARKKEGGPKLCRLSPRLENWIVRDRSRPAPRVGAVQWSAAGIRSGRVFDNSARRAGDRHLEHKHIHSSFPRIREVV
jgi:hypothetical protein